MRPPQEHIDNALNIEHKARKDPKIWATYMECLNNKPMSTRKTDRELYDGCLLTCGVFLRIVDEL